MCRCKSHSRSSPLLYRSGFRFTVHLQTIIKFAAAKNVPQRACVPKCRVGNGNEMQQNSPSNAIKNRTLATEEQLKKDNKLTARFPPSHKCTNHYKPTTTQHSGGQKRQATKNDTEAKGTPNPLPERGKQRPLVSLNHGETFYNSFSSRFKVPVCVRLCVGVCRCVCASCNPSAKWQKAQERTTGHDDSLQTMYKLFYYKHYQIMNPTKLTTAGVVALSC